jgi:hypothetical protein
MYDVYSSWRFIIMLVRTRYYDLFVGKKKNATMICLDDDSDIEWELMLLMLKQLRHR